jgi:hypothetical protein
MACFVSFCQGKLCRCFYLFFRNSVQVSWYLWRRGLLIIFKLYMGAQVLKIV